MLGVSQGEETLTDTLLLYLAGSGNKRIRVWKTPKNIEIEKKNRLGMVDRFSTTWMDEVWGAS